MARWEQVLADVVRTRHSALVHHAFLLTGDRRDAEDLVQDALVRTFARGRDGTDPGTAEAYVRRAILTAYIDGHRRRRRWAAVRHLLADDDARPGPEVRSADRVDLRTALVALSPRQRACVVLRFYEDMTVPQVAEELGVSAGAVKRYLSDGIRALEARMGPLDLTGGEHHTVAVERS